MPNNNLAETREIIAHTFRKTGGIEKNLNKIEANAAEIKEILIDIYKAIEKSYKGNDEIIENARKIFSRFIID